MSYEKKPGSTARGARFVGLGVSAAVAFTVFGAVPSFAVAESDTITAAESATTPEVTVPTAGSEQGLASAPVAEDGLAKSAPDAIENVSDAASSVQEASSVKGGPSTGQSDTIGKSTVVKTDQTTETPATSEQDNAEGKATLGQLEAEKPSVGDSPAGSDDEAGASEAGVASEASSSANEQLISAEASEVTSEPGQAEASVAKAQEVTATASDKVPATSEVQVVSTVASEATVQVPEITYMNMYRLYNPNSGEHFYTSNLGEAQYVARVGWRWENVGWVAPNRGVAVYRLYNPNAGDHHYTASVAERDYLASLGWRYEGIGWYSDTENDALAVWRQYNPNARAGSHNFTTSTAERDHVVSVGWRNEGIGWYAADHANVDLGKGFWLITSAWGSLQRYWIGSNGVLAYNRRVDPSTNTLDRGAGYAAYATTSYGGAVVRGAWANSNGYVYIGDNDGRLIEYRDGTFHNLNLNMGDGTQSYYFGTNGSGKSGFFDVDGKRYYSVPGKGYILKNQSSVYLNGGYYKVDGSGVVTKLELSPNISAALNFANQITRRYGMWRDLFVTVSNATHTFYMWQGSAGNLSYLWSCLCALGKPSTPSYSGYNYISDPQVDFQGAKYAVKYAGQPGVGWHIHSTLLSESPESQLGRSVSNGCIRIPIDRAKWLYDKVTVDHYGGWGWNHGINIYVY